MVHHVALGVHAAHPGTRVHALEVDAGGGRRTIAVDDALGAAGGRRPVVAGQAGAHGPALRHTALGVGAAGGRSTRVRGLRVDDGPSWNKYL